VSWNWNSRDLEPYCDLAGFRRGTYAMFLPLLSILFLFLVDKENGFNK
jgi:hypothetical protein